MLISAASLHLEAETFPLAALIQSHAAVALITDRADRLDRPDAAMRRGAKAEALAAIGGLISEDAMRAGLGIIRARAKAWNDALNFLDHGGADRLDEETPVTIARRLGSLAERTRLRIADSMDAREIGALVEVESFARFHCDAIRKAL